MGRMSGAGAVVHEERFIGGVHMRVADELNRFVSQIF